MNKLKGMNMPLTELEALIQGSHLPNYYEQLLIHHKEIIASVKAKGQKETAEILNIAVGKFNPLYKMIIAYSMIVSKEA